MGSTHVIAEGDYHAFKILVSTPLPRKYEMWLRVRLIFDSANTQLIDLARESAPHGCVGTTFADGRRGDQGWLTGRTVGGRRDAGGGERATGGGTRWRAQQEAFVVLLDLGLVEVGIAK